MDETATGAALALALALRQSADDMARTGDAALRGAVAYALARALQTDGPAERALRPSLAQLRSLAAGAGEQARACAREWERGERDVAEGRTMRLAAALALAASLAGDYPCELACDPKAALRALRACQSMLASARSAPWPCAEGAARRLVEAADELAESVTRASRA